jgi:acyl-CoA thioester hydrolase
MRTYRLERRLSHADVDFLGELKMAALLGLLEQAAVEASSEAGFDAEWYARERRIWIIRRTRLERIVPVGGTDAIAVETAILDVRRARSLRRYLVWRGSELVARATTDWVYCDAESGRPVSVPQSVQAGLFGGERAPVLPRAPAVTIDRTLPASELMLPVYPTHLDHVAHVNNAVYANFLEDAACGLFAECGWPLERMLAAGGALRMSCLDAEYFGNVMAGARLTVRSWSQDTAPTHAQGILAAARVTQMVLDGEGREVVRAASQWVWRGRSSVVGAPPV